MFFTVRNSDKNEIADTAKKYYELGFTLYATKGTAAVIREGGMPVTVIEKIHESDNNPITLLESGMVDYIVSTSSKGRIPTRDCVKIRRKAVERSIPCLTSIDTANALADSLRSRYSLGSTELVDINDMRAEKAKLTFSKMQGCGNDYIYFNCLSQKIDNPEGLSVRLSDRHLSIGGDGVVLICPSDKADAPDADVQPGRQRGEDVRQRHPLRGQVSVRQGTGQENDHDHRYSERHQDGQPGQDERRGADGHGGHGAGAAVAGQHPGEVRRGSDCERAHHGGRRGVPDHLRVHGQPPRRGVLQPGQPGSGGCRAAVRASREVPERLNTEFIKVIDRNTLKMRVWERGSGETWGLRAPRLRGGGGGGGERLLRQGHGNHRQAAGRGIGHPLHRRDRVSDGSAETVYEGIIEI